MKELHNIPKKITPDPILEAVVELRFETDIPAEAIFGLVYNKLSENFPSYENFPILQLPEAVRKNDKSLEFAPYYKFINKNYQIQIGPKVIAIINAKPYTGWEDYFRTITEVIDYLDTLNFIKTITRVGVRYIDFFENENIFEHLNFKVESFPFSIDQSTYITTFLNDSFRTKLQIANGSRIVINSEEFSGSIFDTDTFIDEVNDFNKKNILTIISDAHDLEKKIFYTLIKDEFIEKFNPEYE